MTLEALIARVAQHMGQEALTVRDQSMLIAGLGELGDVAFASEGGSREVLLLLERVFRMLEKKK